MKNTIYNTFVRVTSQEQCDRLKQLCIDNNLPYWDEEGAGFFYSVLFWQRFFGYFEDGDFFVAPALEPIKNKTEVTEEDFIKLIKNK